MLELYGMEVRESLHAVTMEQARKHEKRDGQSENYHKRIMKKWLKRFGKITVPLHPDLMPKLRAACKP
jgi:hypothetical protein